MSLDKNFKRYTGFVPPRFKEVPKDAPRQKKIEIYNSNHTALIEWRRKKFVKYSPHALTYEHVYNTKALYISPEDDKIFRRLHPQDYAQYGPSVMFSLKKGECAVDEANFFKFSRLTEREDYFDEEMSLMQMEDIEWDFTTKTGS